MEAAIDPNIFRLTIFILSIFVGCYLSHGWRVFFPITVYYLLLSALRRYCLVAID